MQTHVLHLSKLSLAIFLASGLTACGGGGSAPSAPTLTPILTSSNYSSFATAYKDDIKNSITALFNAYHYNTGSAYVNSINNLVWTMAGNTSYTSQDAADVAVGLYSRFYNAANVSTNGNIKTGTFACTTGNIQETLIDTQATGGAWRVGDSLQLTFNNCTYGAQSASGVIKATVLAVTGTPEVNGAQAIYTAQIDYVNLSAASSGSYKANGSKTATVDTLNTMLSINGQMTNLYIYSNVNGVITEDTVSGSSVISTNGSTWSGVNTITSETGSITQNGTTIALSDTVQTSPSFSGTGSFLNNSQWSIYSPTSGAISVLINNQKLTLTNTGSGAFLTTVDLDNNGVTDYSTPNIYW